jgi:hypothetical protein
MNRKGRACALRSCQTRSRTETTALGRSRNVAAVAKLPKAIDFQRKRTFSSPQLFKMRNASSTAALLKVLDMRLGR